MTIIMIMNIYEKFSLDYIHLYTNTGIKYNF